tara:strand:- start:398 stop:709 length:312 start_codon:yes stop_codon:yes gene_type:complete
MTTLFINRLQESLESFKNDEINLVLVADKIIKEYYEDQNRNVLNTIEKFREVYIDANNKHIELWTLLCSQVLLLNCIITIGNKQYTNNIYNEIKETLEKFDTI